MRRLLALTVLLAMIVGACDDTFREQTDEKPISAIDAQEPDFPFLYATLAEEGKVQLIGLRSELDRRCAERGLIHFTNLTVVGCAYDLHLSCWSGLLRFESTIRVADVPTDSYVEALYVHDGGGWRPDEEHAGRYSACGTECLALDVMWEYFRLGGEVGPADPKPERKTTKGIVG